MKTFTFERQYDLGLKDSKLVNVHKYTEPNGTRVFIGYLPEQDLLKFLSRSWENLVLRGDWKNTFSTSFKQRCKDNGVLICKSD
jgi:hypothetical protein